MNVDIEIFNLLKEHHGEEAAEKFVELLDKKISDNHDTKRVSTKFDLIEMENKLTRQIWVSQIAGAALIATIIAILKAL